MIMRPGQQLLLPANPLFIWGSLLAALVTNMVMNMGLWGRAAWTPDVLAVVLLFWCVHQPLRIGVGIAFFFGLAMDVHQAGLLGQHALAYSLLSFLAIAVHRRLLWFAVGTQALQVLPLLVACTLVQVVIRLIEGSGFGSWAVLASPFLEAALWPVTSALLLSPQRRAPDPDEDRPL
jgi:rod shape-determining protein MreD